MLQRLLAPAPEDRFSSAAEALSFLKDEPQVLAVRPEVHPFPADVVGTVVGFFIGRWCYHLDV